MSPASRRGLRTAQQGRHLVFEIFEAALLRSGRRAAAEARCGRHGRAAFPAPPAAPPVSAGRRKAASSRCAISARFWSALDGAGAGGGRRRRRRRGAFRRARRRLRTGGVADGRRLTDWQRLAAAVPHAARGSARLGRCGSAASAARCGAGAAGPASGRPPIGSGAKPVSGSLRRSGIGGGAGRRTSSAKEGARRARRRLRHLRFGMIESSVDRESALAASSLQAASGSGAMRGGCSPTAGRGAICRGRASRARYWVRPRCRSGRRSSADVRHCRAGPAPGAGGRPRRRRRSRPAAASVRAWVLAPRRLLAKRRTSHAATPISARTAMNAKRNVSVCIL